MCLSWYSVSPTTTSNPLLPLHCFGTHLTLAVSAHNSVCNIDSDNLVDSNTYFTNTDSGNANHCNNNHIIFVADDNVSKNQNVNDNNDNKALMSLIFTTDLSYDALTVAF